MRRVVIWADEWFPVIGGLELSLHRTALNLAARGLEVIAVTPRDRLERIIGEYEVRYATPEKWLHDSERILDELVGPTDVLYVARLFRKIEKAQLKILSSIRAPRLLRIPTTWSHTRYSSGQTATLIDSGVDGFIALNLATVAQLKRRFPQKATHLCYNWSPPSLTWYSQDRNGFAFAGRLSKSKNVQQLLRAYSLVSDRATLTLLVDPGQYPEEFERCQGQIVGGAKVMMEAPYTPGNLDALERFKYVVLPSFREGCPNILVEAYSRGTPIIGSAIPGVEEHVRAVGAPIIERPFGVEEIARALMQAASIPNPSYLLMQKRVLEYHREHFSRERVAPVLQNYSLTCETKVSQAI